MPDLLIRNIRAETLDALKLRAKENGRSLQAEALGLLERSVKPNGAEFVAWLETVRPKGVDPKILKASSDAAAAAIRQARDER